MVMGTKEGYFQIKLKKRLILLKNNFNFSDNIAIDYRNSLRFVVRGFLIN